MNKNKTHYIVMAGSHGYLPNTCEVYQNRLDAVEALANRTNNNQGEKTNG